MKIRVNGIEIEYRDEGSGVPLVFIHAFPLNQTMWDDQLSLLRGNARVVTFDVRGFGGSEPPREPFSLDDIAEDLRLLLSALGLDRAVMVGLSMGGYIALAFYRKYPAAVRGLVLADTRASADGPEARERRFKSAEKAEREGASAIADDLLPVLLGRTTLESRPGVVMRVRAMIEGNSRGGIAGAQRAMAARRDSTDLLKTIDVPALILVGSEDELTSVDEVESMRVEIKGSYVRFVPGAGHLSNLEQPEAFNEILKDFISRLT